MTHEHPDRGGHEPVSVSARALLLGIAGLAVLIAFALAAMRGYERWLHSGAPPAADVDAEHPTAAATHRTALEPRQRAQRLRYEEQQRQLLSGYAWRDEGRTAARIPIDRAMRLVERRYRSARKEPTKKDGK